jgi:predicted transcriptional regulator
METGSGDYPVVTEISCSTLGFVNLDSFLYIFLWIAFVYTLMAIVTVRVDENLKKKMEQLREVNWSEVTRTAIEQKIKDIELWQPIDLARAKRAADDTDELRVKISGWNSTEEIRKWRQRDRR